jgi:hypothetical protein
MALQILSDLHLEISKAYDIFEIVPRAPYLALLGDIGTVGPHKKEMLDFLTSQLKRLRAVLFVPGNHEAYHSTWPETLSSLRGFELDVRADTSLGEFVLLDRAIFRPSGSTTAVLGCSLFSSVPPESRQRVSLGLNDFFQTGEDWDVDAHNAAHARDLAWLNEQVATLETAEDVDNIVVLTHWSPTTDQRAQDPRHAGSAISTAFSTDLSGEKCFRSAKVKVWAFGHTHYNCDFAMERERGAGPIRLVTNQKGYYFAQSPGFDIDKVLPF